MTRERASGFILPFGRHEGRRLDEVSATGEGRSYLAWLATLDDLAPTIRRAVLAHLGAIRPPSHAQPSTHPASGENLDPPPLDAGDYDR
jgi:hypothetical protein